MRGVFIFTRFAGDAYHARAGRMTASATSSEEAAVQRLAMKYFEVSDPQCADFNGTGIALVSREKCHIEEGFGWQPGCWVAEKAWA